MALDPTSLMHLLGKRVAIAIQAVTDPISALITALTARVTKVEEDLAALPPGGGADTRIGDLADLTTTEKGTVVGAINELVVRLDGLGTVGDVEAGINAIIEPDITFPPDNP